MKVYFVRHGESRDNVRGVHQTGATPLSPLGRRQAHIVAGRFANIPIEVAFSSDYIRASETAQAIRNVTGVRIRHIPLLREVKRPTEVEGLEHRDEAVQRVDDIMYENRHNPQWHYSDEENFFDLRQRSRQFVDFLNKLNVKNALVVSHSITLRMIVGSMIFGDLLNPDLFTNMCIQMRIKNTGITVCERTRHGWKLVVWNDHAHLG